MVAGKIQEEKMNRDGLKGEPQIRALTSYVVLQDQGGGLLPNYGPNENNKPFPGRREIMYLSSSEW